jgi:hypothetical protein
VPCRPGRRMALSMMQRCLAVVWSVLTIGLAVTGAEAQPTVTVTMRLAEAEWHVVTQEVLPRFEAVSTTASGSTSHQKLWCNACGQCSRPDAWRLTSLRRTICVFRNWSIQPWLPLALPGLAVCGLLVWLLSWEEFTLATYLTLGAKTMPLQVYYYLYQGNWFDTAVAATLMTVPVLTLSAFLQRYLRETNLAGVMR